MPEKKYSFLLNDVNKYLEITKVEKIIHTNEISDYTQSHIRVLTSDDCDFSNPCLWHGIKPSGLKVLFYIAQQQDEVTNDGCELGHFNSFSNKVSEVNRFFKNAFEEPDFSLITKQGQSIYRINGHKVKQQKELTINDFFEVFLKNKKISKISVDNAISVDVDDITNHVKEIIFFRLFSPNFSFEKISCDLVNKIYRATITFINTNSHNDVFKEMRSHLKELLISDDIFSSEMPETSQVSSFEKLKELKKDIENLEQKKREWQNSNTIFPKQSQWYAIYKETVFKILDNDYKTGIDNNWVSNFRRYDFSTEKQCIDIDDIIVSFALLALSSYQIDNRCESKVLKDDYKQAVENLIKEHFNENGSNFISEISKLMIKIEMDIRQGKLTEAQGIQIISENIHKYNNNKNVYYNEENDHSITKS